MSLGRSDAASFGQNSLYGRMVSIKKLGNMLEGFSLLPTFPHQRFLLLAVINPASLFHLQHSHCLRSLQCVASTG
jgi:hypothetical protein